jgi:CRP/FNR family transcriptional regulator/CRP/FNR family cyclic AMP-dependent transcriptional regulator
MPDNAFARSPLLARIDADDLKALARVAIRRSFAAGEIMFLRDEPGDGMFAIVSGRVRVFVEGGSGSSGDVTIAIRGQGEVLGEMSLLDGMARSASARAIDSVTALYVSKQSFDDWLAPRPAAARAMLEALARRLREATDQVAEIALLSVEARVARHLWLVFVDAAMEGEPQPGASLRVNQTRLASSIGVTRESVNKHLARLKQANVIDVTNGRVTLRDPQALQAAAAEL